MDNRRLILFGALFALMFFTYMQWQQFVAERSPLVTHSNTQVQNEQAPLVSESGATPVVASDSETVSTKGQTIEIDTPLVQATLTSAGGHINSLFLKAYPVDIDHKDDPFPLMNNRGPVYLTEGSGLTSNQLGLVPDHNTEYSAKVVPADGGQQVVFTHYGDNGIKTTKTYSFYDDKYHIDVNYHVENGSDAPLVLSHYAFLQRNEQAPPGSGGQFAARSFFGGAIYSDETKYEKHDFGDLADNDAAQDTSNGWIAMLQHYFVTGWLPGIDVPLKISSKKIGDDLYRLQYVSQQTRKVAVGESMDIGVVFYAGPKVKANLEALPGTDFDLTIDFGWLTIISNPLLVLLKLIYSFVGNWGWAIIGVTIIVKAVFFPLSAAAYRSSAKMRKLSPRLATLKERYGEDRQQFQQEMMKLYKEEKINPAGGCLPILVQIPVFIALYWVLLESVELRQANFMWLRDLSIPDPIFVLPVLYFITMWAMQKLNPAPLDPMQQKVMAAMPFIFSIMMVWFPAGLVLYWVVNNALSLTQQWYITRRYA